jgi:hypothetical protein
LEPLPIGQATELYTLPHISVEEGSVQSPGGEEGYPQDGDGTLAGHDLGVECPLTSCSVRDPVSLHPVVKHRRHYLRVPEDGRSSG